MFIQANTPSIKYIVKDPPLAQKLFDDMRLAWIWTHLRFYVGYEWIVAGWEKIINPGWVGAEAGNAPGGFINHSLTLSQGTPPAVQGWYAVYL